MSQKTQKIIKPIAFLLIAAICFVTLTRIVTNPGQRWGYQFMAGFQAEPKESIDVVFLGSSSFYDAVEAPIIWGESGISAWNLTTRAQTVDMARYLLEYASGRQPDALFVLYVNNLQADYTVPHVHYTTDYMPLSMAKLKLIRDISRKGGYSLRQSLEFYFPMIRYHSRWDSLTSADYSSKLDGLKSGIASDTFMTDWTDLSKKYKNVETITPISDSQQQSWDELLGYIEEKGLKVLFLTTPRSEGKAEEYGKINAVNAMLRERGFDTLDLRDYLEETGLDLTRDWFNTKHTNIHGALKISGFLADYLKKEYDFEDKRGQKGYESWDEAYDLYQEAVQVTALDFEVALADRDYSLDAPAVKRVANNDGGSLTFSWTKSKGADGYVIYRKDVRTDGNWAPLDTVGSGVTSYTETGLKKAKKYCYRVVPFRMEGGEKVWGKYDFDGVVFAVK